MTRYSSAPCGCEWRSEWIERAFRILFPTVFVDCRCQHCDDTWVERYEFDFSIPIGGLTHKQVNELQ